MVNVIKSDNVTCNSCGKKYKGDIYKIECEDDVCNIKINVYLCHKCIKQLNNFLNLI